MIESLLQYIKAFNPDYITSGVHRYLCSKIQTAVDQGNARLAISIPPRHGKSEIISKALPAYYYSKHPDAQIMEICYGSDLASDFGAQVRKQMSSPMYRSLYPDSVPSGEGKAGGKWSTVSGGLYKGVGITGAITGFGANLMIIDDIVKNRQEAHSDAFKDLVRTFFGSTLFSRLLPGGSVIILMTRWTANDLVGIVTSLPDQNWEYINLPALCDNPSTDPLHRAIGEPLFPEFYPRKKLLEIKSICSEYDWLSLYQGQPPDSVSQQSLTYTPPHYYPSTAVWYGGVLGLFAEKNCTHLVDCDTFNELLTYLSSLPPVKELVTDHPVATKSNIQALMPYRLKYASTTTIPGYSPSIECSVPQGSQPTARQFDCIRQYQLTKALLQHPSSNRLSGSKLIYRDVLTFY